MDLIGHRHSQAVAKLQLAVKQSSSAACATLGTLLARGLMSEHQSQSHPNHSTGSRSPVSSPPAISEGSFSKHSNSHSQSHLHSHHHHHHHHQIHQTYTDHHHHPGSHPSHSRPQLSSRALSHTPPTSHNPDALAAAQLFLSGLEIELNKPVQPASRSKASTSKTKVPENESLSEDESAEGKYFSLERSLDLSVGLTDSYRYGIVCPPLDYDASVPASAKDLWSQGAAIAQRALAHPAIATPSVSSQTNAPDTSKTPPLARSRSIARSYNHPSTVLPPAVAHPHLSLKAKLRLTITVHLLYLLALQTWVTDKARAESYWQEIVNLGSNLHGGVGIKEGEEVVERARRRIAGIHRTEGPDEDWHLAKAKKRGRGRGGFGKVSSGISDASKSAATSARGSTRQTSGDAVLDMRMEAEAVAQARAQAQEAEGEPSSVSSAITIKGVPIRKQSNGSNSPVLSSSHGGLSRTLSRYGSTASSPMSTSVGGGRTPRPSKFHFAPDLPTDYPSPPDTPGSSPKQHDEDPLEQQPSDLARSSPSLSTTVTTTEPESYFSEGPSPSSARSAHTSHSASITNHRRFGSKGPDEGAGPRRRHRVISAGAASFASNISLPALNATSRLLARVGSSASICTLPSDFGSTTRKGKGRAVEGPAINNHGVQARFSLPYRQSADAQTTEPSSRWNWSSLKAHSSRLLSSLSHGNEGTGKSAMDALKQALQKDEDSAPPLTYWGLLEEEVEETEHENEDGEVDGEGEGPTPLLDSDIDDIIVGSSHIYERLSVMAGPAEAVIPRGEPSKEPESTAFESKISPKKVDHALHRVKAPGAANRSFVDVTSACDDYPTSRPRLHSRKMSANGKPPSPEQGGIVPPSALVAPKFGRLEHRSFSSPNLGGGGDKMDPLLLELERRSRVGVRTVCATCGNKGLNYPTSRGGRTYCSRDCRVKDNTAGSGCSTPSRESISSS
ncbi:BQ2448_348 [Microbotryum intermedium]|uniref:BQ2448_348 protein n=1 Tax=Microbotryum intermedium TaxID=269621 RepID=A0A238F5B7_9BASI|nr:BQ2448_348 [Microbotryum intermedium]